MQTSPTLVTPSIREEQLLKIPFLVSNHLFYYHSQNRKAAADSSQFFLVTYSWWEHVLQYTGLFFAVSTAGFGALK